MDIFLLDFDFYRGLLQQYYKYQVKDIYPKNRDKFEDVLKETHILIKILFRYSKIQLKICEIVYVIGMSNVYAYIFTI